MWQLDTSEFTIKLYNAKTIIENLHSLTPIVAIHCIFETLIFSLALRHTRFYTTWNVYII